MTNTDGPEPGKNTGTSPTPNNTQLGPKNENTAATAKLHRYFTLYYDAICGDNCIFSIIFNDRCS